MKKLKIMLLSFALLAIVGTALAFKARFADTYFCTAATNGNGSGDLCTFTQGPEFGNKLYCREVIYSTTDNSSGLPLAYYCTTFAQALFGGPAPDDCADALGQNPLRCADATTLYLD
jgi:hypothetical protein